MRSRTISRAPASCRPTRRKYYWRDVGTVDAYWGANIDLTDIVPDLDLYDSDWPIWTYGEITPPAKFVHDVEGRRGLAFPRFFPAAVSSRAPLSPLAFVYRRARQFLFARHEAVIMPYARSAGTYN